MVTLTVVKEDQHMQGCYSATKQLILENKDNERRVPTQHDILKIETADMVGLTYSKALEVSKPGTPIS